ncbi:putative Extracellular ligand-binding receptor [Forsythia ovata]|uniref:Extracellular ligand-binding receptor n=1 Tax=Forsythia ovata TaxID=205694 RepID=A0ABD1RIS6_9LAMI
MANVCRYTTLRFFIFFGLLSDQLYAADFISSPSYDNSIQEIEVGVIVDMGSWVGKTIHACISMAISDFYESNSHYTTRIVLHARDSSGKPIRALSAGILKSRTLEEGFKSMRCPQFETRGKCIRSPGQPKLSTKKGKKSKISNESREFPYSNVSMCENKMALVPVLSLCRRLKDCGGDLGMAA